MRYNYARFGYTRGGGKTWHGGIDLEALDDETIYMPTYKGKSISGTVTRARIVTDKRNATWEWGYYVCVQLDTNQTPDAVNFLYFCHCAKLLVKAGQKVKSGDVLAVMGNTGNAALADPPYKHCHFEVRATATGKGLDPTAYAGCPNEVGTYGETASENTEVDYIDVSKWQGTIDWAKVPAKAFIRIGYRGYGSAGTLALDSCFEKNLTGAIANGKLAGFYFFSQAVNADDGRAEADYAVKALNGRGKGLPIFFDAEYSGEASHKGRADGISKDARTAAAKAFCERVAELGYLPGVYTFTNFAYNNIEYANLVLENGYIGWLADSRTNYDTSLPRHLHQYGQGSVAGITGTVDLNHLVKTLHAVDKPASKLQVITIGPVSQGDADAIYLLCRERGLTDVGLYKSEWVEV